MQLVRAECDGLGRSFQAVGRVLTPNDAAVQPIDGIASRCGVHASSLVRFSRMRGLQEAQGALRSSAHDGAPGFDARVGAIEDDPKPQIPTITGLG